MGALLALLPTIVQTIQTGSQLLADWQSLAAKPGGPSDEELAALAAKMESALAASQAALRAE